MNMQTIERSGLLTLPKAGKGPAILVLPAWWGLNDFFKKLCQRFAAQGYVVWAPDYYNGRFASTAKEAYQFKAKLNQKEVFSNLLAMVEQLRHSDIVTRKAISVIGFSMGARFALELSSYKPRSITEVVVYYGTSIVDFSKARAAYQGHFSERDEWFAASGVEKLKKLLQVGGHEVTFYTYPGTAHWFFESNCRERYKPIEANLAWKRTIQFLKQHH